MFKGTTARELAMTVNTGEVIEMVYMGGSKPGAIRKVIVLMSMMRKSEPERLDLGLPKNFLFEK